MQALPQIPGVELEVYKEHRRLEPETDGCLGQLWSGSVVILAVIDPKLNPVISLFRDGSDHYINQKDWLNNPTTDAQKKCHQLYLAERTFTPKTQVFGVKVPLRVDDEHSFNRVHYPENMLMLLQFTHDDNQQPTGNAIIWKIALVSQDGQFFITVQEAYSVQAYEDGKSKLRFPRLGGHKQLERLLIAGAPDNLPRLPLSSFEPESKLVVNGLKSNEGIVERWYDARNMGCIVTSQGTARVHWREAPPRPQRRFLIEGERIQFSDIKPPPQNPKTQWRPVRKSRFRLQAHGVAVVGE